MEVNIETIADLHVKLGIKEKTLSVTNLKTQTVRQLDRPQEKRGRGGWQGQIRIAYPLCQKNMRSVLCFYNITSKDQRKHSRVYRAEALRIKMNRCYRATE